jgi:hypothetical protein
MREWFLVEKQRCKNQGSSQGRSSSYGSKKLNDFGHVGHNEETSMFILLVVTKARKDDDPRVLTCNGVTSWKALYCFNSLKQYLIVHWSI